MNLLKRLWLEEDGQGLVEYTMVVVLVTFVFWMGVKGTDVGSIMADSWTRVTECVTSPFSCAG
jgi:Flp pilus assembly pilin Flp